VFEAKVKDATLGGVDLIELDEADRISSLTVAVATGRGPDGARRADVRVRHA
jgi:hypothetical protein